jgi:PBP1b-binding outer membrane lipoprotein LpoB
MKKTSITNIVAVLGVAHILTGCASVKEDLAQASSHPANPQAAESVQPPATPMLMASAPGSLLPISTNRATDQTEINYDESEKLPSKIARKRSEPQKHEHEQKKDEK